MKTKLTQAEKARRQEWRDRQYAKPSANPPHHLTNAERKALAKPVKPIMSAAEYFSILFHVDPKPEVPVKKPYLKMRARKKHSQA